MKIVNSCMDLLTLSSIFLGCIVFCKTHEAPGQFSYKDHLTDTEHLKEDLRGVVNKDDVLTQKDSVFYYFTLHDKDHNNLLDGTEIASSFFHIYTHNPHHEQVDYKQAIEIQVDSILKYDTNNDGFLSFDEYVASLRDININLVNSGVPPRRDPLH